MTDKPVTTFTVSVFEKPHWRRLLTTKDKAKAMPAYGKIDHAKVKGRCETGSVDARFFLKVTANDLIRRNSQMNIKTLTMGAMALAMMTGSALAAGSTSALDDPAKMSPFFTDAGMKTLRTEKDFTTAWKAMKPDEQKAVLKDCGDTTLNKSHADFCLMAKKMGG